MSIAKTKNPGFAAAFAIASMTATVLGNASCVRDTDCGICDPDNLILESISGLNYASKKVHYLNPKCDGDDCPKAIKKGSYFVEEVLPCDKAEDTLDFIQKLVDDGIIEDNDKAKAPYIDEFCKISPLVVAFGIEFVFNNLLDPTTVELVRKRPDQPKLFEVYEWKTKILDILGPTSRYNGDFTKGAAEVPDVITRLVSLSCIDNLRDMGQDYSNEDYEDPTTNPCNTVFDHDDDNDTPPVPLKMRIGTEDSKLQSYRGITTAGSNSCDTPQDGADTCCTECDFLLGTKVAKYGLDESGNRRTPENAITCNAEQGGDFLVDCRDFIVGVERGDNRENSYDYYWDAPAEQGGEQLTKQPIPQYDRIRETHPADRPAWIEKKISPCSNTAECADVHGLPGGQPPATAYICIGENDEGQTCLPGVDDMDTCTTGFCRPQWFVYCAADADTTGGGTGYCIDARFSDAGAAACYRAGDDFEGQCNEEGQSCRDFNSGQRLANCNGETPVDSNFTAAECCQSSLGAVDLDETEDGIQCDPFFQSDISPVARYDRNENLPDQTRACVCRPLSDMDQEELDLCGRTVESVCYGPDGEFLDFREGEYAVKFIDRRGGVVYDPAIKGVEWRPADLGGIPRAEIETCAEAAGRIGVRGRHEGWRANDSFVPENFEDYDRAMCSGQEYTVRFGVPGENEFITDKVGNTMEGHAEYTFTTTQFHVVPGSGFPTDNLRIGACDQFSLRFSNKYDMSPENQRKLEIWRLDDKGTADPEDDEVTTPNDDCGEIVPVAGGIDCVASKDGLVDEMGVRKFCAAPCLTVDIADQGTGEIRVEIDPTEFGPVLKVRSRYRMKVAGLDELDDIDNADGEAYREAFWDACGMPLVAEDARPYDYDFTIDTPKCKEDEDNDTIQLSCDNAPDNFNPDQEDLDRDGIGDVVDLCPTVAAATGNSADSDKDGVGNDCDVCRQTLTQYNDVDSSISVPDYMFVRNIPWQGDTDEDGIGDVCDNCVVTPNCENYGTANPYQVGDPVDVTDKTRCQRDDDADLIGDDCAAEDPLPEAAGPVGIAPMDDFDQDGITNANDACPRQPVPERVTCESAADCSDIQDCDDGVCNHIDSDSDGVGDICDSCPFTGNPMQTMDGAAQEEDPDGDFVADVCETNSACSNISDARPFSFYPVSANGQCCTVQLVEDPMGNLVNAITDEALKDPDGWPISLSCVEPDDEEERMCRRLPSKVENAPGILQPPPGCEQALADAGITAAENERLGLEDVGSVDELWNTLCFLPQTDQDYDGLGDPCDYCTFAYDPDNQSYVDANGRAWPNYGKYCFGDYDPEVSCEMGDTSDDTGSGSESGTESSGGGMMTEDSGGMGTTGPG